MFRTSVAATLAAACLLAVAWPLTAAVAQSTAPAPSGAASSVATYAPSAQDGRWQVRLNDVTLSKTLERWAAEAGYKLKWDAPRDFLIGAADVYVGDFEGALQQVLSSPGIRYSDFPLEACIYANTPPLVRVTRQGEQSRLCAAVTAN